jgi:hypothetical protein
VEEVRRGHPREGSDCATQRQAELEEFMEGLLEKPPREIVQFLRGRHFFFAD